MILELISVLTILSLAALYLWFYYRSTGKYRVKSVSNGYHLMLEYKNVYGGKLWNVACYHVGDFSKPVPILFPTKELVEKFIKNKL